MDLLPFLFLVLLLISITYPHCAKSTAHNNFTDLESLLAFKDNVTDPNNIISTNWTTNTSFCNWIGITCSRRHQRVSSLILRDFSLHGNISPHLTNLSFLSLLDLRNNSLTGTIPDTLAQLPRLQLLYLGENSLSGSIPYNLFNMSLLLELHLADNNLSGTLPLNSSLIMLPRVQGISLGFNHLTGRLPSIFTKCSDLQLLFLSVNNFTGTLPFELGHLQQLRMLYLSANPLSGNIPSSFGNLTMLRVLELNQNNLEGQIPKEFGNLPNLVGLYLNFNYLTGSIPTSLLNASMISYIDLTSNKLSGSVPTTLGESMPRIIYLDLQENLLTGSLDFITSLSNCRELLSLGLSRNELTGSVPNSIGNLSEYVQTIDIDTNLIKGNIPAHLANLSSLLGLNLEYNELKGSIPASLSRLEGLQAIGFGYNRLEGSIPSELGLMKSLNILSVEGNYLSGSIPDSLGNLTSLKYLGLAANRLSSEIPKSLWRLDLLKINISQNSLHGSIPPEVGNLKSLDTLDLSKNRFSGNISSALGQLQMVRGLDLSSNSFHGEIPKSFGQLIIIEYLNLSKNYLSGEIPKPLANLKNLDSLDVSFNMLEGQIPEGGVFSNLNIPSLKGNKGLCGAPQLGFPPCSTDIDSHSRRYQHRSLKFILPAVSFIVVVFCCLFVIFTKCWRKKKTLANIVSPRLGDHRFISYHDLVRATDNFSPDNLMGRGYFGSVFKGCLDNGSNVAVKVLNLEVEGASKSFDAECEVLRSVRHRNLIKIISVCSNLDFKALILQYMSNKSLDQWLYSENYCLSLLQRLNIMSDVSSALEYLHHNHPHVVLHCDLKPGNVLLDEEMTAHVGDFGIAKLLLGEKSIASTSAPGTIGYIAPEYGSTGTVSKMGDVYSFGILLLETFTRKKPTEAMFDGESSLNKWICRAFLSSKTNPTALLDIVDKNIWEDGSHARQQPETLTAMHTCISSIIELGLLCSSDSPRQRIPMTSVVPQLKNIKAEYLAQLRSV